MLCFLLLFLGTSLPFSDLQHVQQGSNARTLMNSEQINGELCPLGVYHPKLKGKGGEEKHTLKVRTTHTTYINTILTTIGREIGRSIIRELLGQRNLFTVIFRGPLLGAPSL